MQHLAETLVNINQTKSTHLFSLDRFENARIFQIDYYLIWFGFHPLNRNLFDLNEGSVTLMGHSTGAACVNLLMLSPVAQGGKHK